MTREATERTKLKRHPERGSHERDTVNAILDEAYICHLSFVVDGAPVVIPTIHARDGDSLLVHGSAASRALRTSADVDVCVAVTLLDGLVLARSHFHHSMNYRSVVVFGRAERVTDEAEKRAALATIVEHVVPGRTADARPPTDLELRATLVLRLPLDEASAKVRTGGPLEDEVDLDLPVWAGVVPLRLVAGDPIPDEAQEPAQAWPGYALARGPKSP